MSDPCKKYLAIDLGKRYVGYAYSDGQVTVELSVKHYDALRTAFLSNDVYHYIKKYCIDVLVLGLNAQVYRDMYSDYLVVKEICSAESIVFICEDERMTTSMFKRFKFKNDERRDSLSAVAILENYLHRKGIRRRR